MGIFVTLKIFLVVDFKLVTCLTANRNHNNCQKVCGTIVGKVKQVVKFQISTIREDLK